MVETSLDGINLVASNPKLLQANQCVQALNALYLVITNPEGLKVRQAIQSLNGPDAVMREVDLLETDAFVEPIDFGYFIFVEP